MHFSGILSRKDMPFPQMKADQERAECRSPRGNPTRGPPTCSTRHGIPGRASRVIFSDLGGDMRKGEELNNLYGEAVLMKTNYSMFFRISHVSGLSSHSSKNNRF